MRNTLLALDQPGPIHVLLGVVGIALYTWMAIKAWRFVDRAK
jgi:hypothetical protein